MCFAQKSTDRLTSTRICDIVALTEKPQPCILLFWSTANFAVIFRAFSKQAQPPLAQTPRQYDSNRLTLLLADTDGATSSAGGLGVLTSDTEAPVVSETTVSPDLLQAFQILTQLALHSVCQHLGVLAINDITLSVEKPLGDLVLSRVLDDGDNSLEFFRSDFTGTMAQS